MKGTVFASFSETSMPLGHNNFLFLYTNILDRDEVAKSLFSAVAYDTSITGQSVLLRNFQKLNTIYASDFVVSDVIGFGDILKFLDLDI